MISFLICNKVLSITYFTHIYIGHDPHTGSDFTVTDGPYDPEMDPNTKSPPLDPDPPLTPPRPIWNRDPRGRPNPLGNNELSSCAESKPRLNE